MRRHCLSRINERWRSSLLTGEVVRPPIEREWMGTNTLTWTENKIIGYSVCVLVFNFVVFSK